MDSVLKEAYENIQQYVMQQNSIIKDSDYEFHRINMAYYLKAVDLLQNMEKEE